MNVRLIWIKNVLQHKIYNISPKDENMQIILHGILIILCANYQFVQNWTWISTHCAILPIKKIIMYINWGFDK
jgi:hypothetical protein